MMYARTVEGAHVELYPRTDAQGQLRTAYDGPEDRVGTGGWNAADLVIRGPRGGYVVQYAIPTYALRDLARAAARLADFTDARAKGERGPCVCGRWHPMGSCPNLAAMDYSMCRACWTREEGQQAHDDIWHDIDHLIRLGVYSFDGGVIRHANGDTLYRED